MSGEWKTLAALGVAALIALVVALHIVLGVSLWWLLAVPALAVVGIAIGGALVIALWISSGGH